MIRNVLFLFVFLVVLTLQVEAQKKECKLKPKRFSSAFTHMTSDYANMNLQADVLPKRFSQIESSILFGSLFRNVNGENHYGYNSNLFRFGLGANIELRGLFAIPGQNVKLNDSEIETLNWPLGIGMKANILSESSSTPGIGVTLEYVYCNALSHIQTCLIFDKLFFRMIKLSFSAGPQFSINSISKFAYSGGIAMKDRNRRLGVYSMISNRYEYLKNVFNMGLIVSDNLNYQITIGYGVNQNQGIFMFSYSGLINYSNLQRKFGHYFSRKRIL